MRRKETNQPASQPTSQQASHPASQPAISQNLAQLVLCFGLRFLQSAYTTSSILKLSWKFSCSMCCTLNGNRQLSLQLSSQILEIGSNSKQSATARQHLVQLSFSQPVGQPASQPANQPSSQPARQPANQPSSQPASQPANQQARQAARQPAISQNLAQLALRWQVEFYKCLYNFKHLGNSA